MTILLPPVNLNGPKFRGGDIHAENDAEGRDHVSLRLKARSGGADGEEVISVCSVLRGAYKVILAASGKWLGGSRRERRKKDVKEGIPVARGGNVTLTSANDSIETPEILRRGAEGEGFGAAAT